MIVLVISCTFDLYCKLYYEIELVSYQSYPIKLFKKTKNQKHGGNASNFSIFCASQHKDMSATTTMIYTTSEDISLSIQTKVITQENLLSCSLIKIQEKVVSVVWKKKHCYWIINVTTFLYKPLLASKSYLLELKWCSTGPKQPWSVY